jgi:hypothetical protein
VKVLPVKALDAQGYGPYSAVANGIIYAVDHGARVINLSLVGTAPSPILQAAVDYASAHDAVLVAAAGNYGTDAPGYPAASNGAVAIAAINDADAHPQFSNYGALGERGRAWRGPRHDHHGRRLRQLDRDVSGGGVQLRRLRPAPLRQPDDEPQRGDPARADGAVDLGTTGGIRTSGWGRVDAYAALVPGEDRRAAADNTPPTISHPQPDQGQSALEHGADRRRANDNCRHRTGRAVRRQPLVRDDDDARPTRSSSTRAHARRRPQAARYAYDTSNHVARTKSLKVSFTTAPACW